MDNKPPPRIILPKAEPGSSSSSPTLDSIPAGSEVPAKRRCISSACMPCRRRKSKCDGVQPACNACTSVYSSQCYYDIDSDHRRKGALKRDIAQLKEELVSQNIILNAIKRGSDAEVDDIIQLVRANPDESYDSIAESIQKMSLTGKQKPGHSETSSGLEGQLADFSVKPSFSKTGGTRHYGNTSNLNWVATEDEQPSIAENQLGSWTNVTNDLELINHLLDVYFTWSHPFYLMFPEEVFYHGLRDRKLKYCTPLLVNAILATACNFSDRPGARADPEDPTSIGDHFFAEAKRLLLEDDRSCLTTVQALGLMSIRQAMNSKDSNGWLYAGQMMSMSIQLGLHMQYGVQPNEQITASEIEARRVTFWGVFVLETLWAICVGRISSLPRAAIRLEKPRLLPYLENNPWKPHGLTNYDGGPSELQQPSLKYSLLLQNSLLAEILDDIIHMFYAPKDRITSRKLQQHHEKLKAWYRELPEGLRTDNKTGFILPQVLTLHIYYHSCVVHLFRPFLKVSFVQNVKPPRQICTEHANTISRLIDQFSRTYGLRRAFFVLTHCAMSAGIIHLINVSSTTTTINPAIRQKSEIDLADTIRALHAMQQSFPIVERFLSAIKNLTHKWCTVIPARVREAMVDVEMGSPSSTSTDPQNKSLSNYDNAHFPNGLSSSNPNNMSNGSSETNERKHSAPDLVQMAPPPHIDLPSVSTSSYQQQFLWTPFPDAFDGLPLPMPQEAERHSSGGLQNMNITNMLDGKFPQLNQDGFTILGEGDGVWDMNWDVTEM